MRPADELAKTYRTSLSYQKQFNFFFTSPTITLKTFQELYGILYFDLTAQETEVKSGSVKIQLKYSLKANPTANYMLFAMVLHEEELSIDVISGRAVLRA